MIKNYLLIFAFFLFAGCGMKETVVQANRTHHPIVRPAPMKITKPTQVRAQIPSEVAVQSQVADMGDLLNKSNSRSYVTTLKTKKFAFSDAGFIQNKNGVINLQILALGKPLLKLKISDDVCVNHHCRTKQEFNANYLSSDYPYDLINNVLSSQPIFSGENMQRTSNGFMQRIKSPHYDIKYKIAPGSVYFKDIQNNIVIKLRELH